MLEKNNLNKIIFEKIFDNKILIIIVFFVGIFLRLYKYDIVPFGINHDSSAVVLEAIDISLNPLPYSPYSNIDSKGETFILYLLAGFIKLFGHLPANIKLYSTIISSLLLPIFYFTLRKIFNKEIALFSLMFLCLSGWHIIMGKTAWPAILLPITECLFIYFFYLTLVEKKYKYAFLSGFSLALVMNSYNAAKFMLIYLIFIIVILLIKFYKKVNLDIIKLFLVFLLSFIFFFSPLGFYIKNNYTQYASRGSSLYIGNQIKEARNLNPLKDNIIKTIRMHLFSANGNDFFVNEPLIDPLTSYFFVIGFCFIIFLIKDIRYLFLLSGFILSLLPGLLSIPNGNRGIGSLPFAYLIAGIGLYYLFKIIKKFNQKIAVLSFFIIFIITFVITFNLYLGCERRELFGFYPETTIVGNYIKSRLNSYDFYLTDNYPQDALTFLTYQGGNPYIKHYDWIEKKEDFLNVKRERKGIQFIMFDTPGNRFFIPNLQKTFPNGVIHTLDYKDDSINRKAALIYIVK